MTFQDIHFSIQDALFEFQYKNGKDPDCIFMSSQLTKYLWDNIETLYDTTNIKGVYGKFRGIDVISYNCSEPQYYLAEGPGMFKEYMED